MSESEIVAVVLVAALWWLTFELGRLAEARKWKAMADKHWVVYEKFTEAYSTLDGAYSKLRAAFDEITNALDKAYAQRDQAIKALEQEQRNSRPTIIEIVD